MIKQSRGSYCSPSAYCCLIEQTFVFASHPIGSGRIDNLSTDDVSENSNRLVRPVVLFENLAVTDWSSVRYQHDGLVALGSLHSSVVLKRRGE